MADTPWASLPAHDGTWLWRFSGHVGSSAPQANGMILIDRRVDLDDATCRVVWAGPALAGLWAVRGERDDRLVRGADAGQAGQGRDRRDAAGAAAGGGRAGSPAGRSGPDDAGTRRRRARAVWRLGPRRRHRCRARGDER